MSSTELKKFFAERAAENAALVLASVYETQGSTYSKTGARMLITGDGIFQGMLSGGCLEGDLAERARRVVETGEAERVTYDLGLNEEELWGLGVGCDGLMKIFLQPLVPELGYEPFATMARVLDGDETGIAATVIESADGGVGAGATLVRHAGGVESFGLASAFVAVIDAEASRALADRTSKTVELGVDGRELRVLLALLEPPPTVLVLGGGLDAEPVVRLCAGLGWRVTVQDHRPAYIENGDFSQAVRVVCGPAERLPEVLDLDRFDAAIIMSHHLDTDRKYLSMLAATDMQYIGLLGPRDRRIRLLDDLGGQARALEGRVHGPAGLDLGGRGPASIALSIVAEMHRVLIGAG